MQWLRSWLMRLFRVPVVEFKPIRFEGEPIGDFTLENWKAVAEMFARVPGLKDAVAADFEDTMAALKDHLVSKDKGHLELIRLGQKAVDLWAHLSMPKTALSRANEILSAMEREQLGTDRKAPSTQTVM